MINEDICWLKAEDMSEFRPLGFFTCAVEAAHRAIGQTASVVLTICLLTGFWGGLALLSNSGAPDARLDQSAPRPALFSSAANPEQQEEDPGASTAPVQAPEHPPPGDEAALPMRQDSLSPPAAPVEKEASHALEPAASPSGLPDGAAIHVIVSYAAGDEGGRQRAIGAVRALRGGGLVASDPVSDAHRSAESGIAYFYEEDRENAARVEHGLHEQFGSLHRTRPAPGAPMPRPGTILLLVSAGNLGSAN